MSNVKVSLFTVFTAMFFWTLTPVQAECPFTDDWCHERLHCVEAHLGAYGTQVSHKAGSGFANIAAALTLTDITEGVSDGMFIGTTPCKRATYGTIGGLEGLGEGAYRLVAGIVELGTSPFPLLGPFRYPRKNYFDEYCEPTAYGTVSPFAIITSVVGE